MKLRSNVTDTDTDTDRRRRLRTLGSVDMFAETPVRVVDRVVEEVEEAKVVGEEGLVEEGVEEGGEGGAGTEEEELATVEEVRRVEDTIDRSKPEEPEEEQVVEQQEGEEHVEDEVVEEVEEQVVVEEEVEEQVVVEEVEEQVVADLPNTEDFLGGISEEATSTQEIQEVSWATSTHPHHTSTPAHQFNYWLTCNKTQ